MEYSTVKYHKMNMLHVLRMILMQSSGLNAPIRTVKYGVMQTVWSSVKMLMFV